MGAPEKILTIARADWGAALGEILAPCFTRSAALAEIARQVEGGVAYAFTADDGGGIVGAFVLRVDGREGVILAAAGGLDGVALIPALLEHIESRFIGCDCVRFHTARPGMAQVMGRLGYEGQEVVMRKDLK
jgi:hypothetical protein